MPFIKRLYSYILQAFLPMFLMTFAICSFILLMQFLWKYVEDIVGKGLETTVLAELFFYAALGVIPMALPLAILLASLMTFGNLGEKFELTAIKAAGISLLRAMRPLIVVIALISIGAFFFQNEAMPKINVKMTSLLRSVKMKSPELDIPEGSFYTEIENYNLYVKKKNQETGMLYHVMIYDISKGFDNMYVIVCDSAKMRMSSGKDYLLLNLYSGQQFANFQKPGESVSYNRNNKFVPYSRENFREKEIVIQFDATFNRMDESSLLSTQIAKNIKELQTSIDSISHEVDSMNIADRRMMFYSIYQKELDEIKDTTKNKKLTDRVIAFDSLMASLDIKDLNNIYTGAASESVSNSSNLLFRSMAKLEAQSGIRQHNVEWHRKFTLSFACLIFFFIGAPLGAIIRKGGLGMPVVISVILFIVYYIFDNVGRKMARDGVWDVWQGIWLSSFILFPLGVFLTYKAINDSALFNTEAYGNFFRKALRLNKKVIYETNTSLDATDIPDLSTLNADPDLVINLRGRSIDLLTDVVQNYQVYGYDQSTIPVALAILKEKGATVFNIIKSRAIDIKEARGILTVFLKSFKASLISYVSSIFIFILSLIVKNDLLTTLGFVSVALYIIFYIRSLICFEDFYRSIDEKPKRKVWIMLAVSFVLMLISYFYVIRQMRQKMTEYDKD